MNERQTLLLGELEAVVVWSARYQTPREFRDYIPRQTLHAVPTTPGTLGGAHRDEINELVALSKFAYEAAEHAARAKAQGYFFGKPTPLDIAEQVLDKHYA